MKNGYLGVDVGSVSTNLVVLDEEENVIASVYLQTAGQPIKVVQEGMRRLAEIVPEELKILGAGTTGSGRTLAGVLIGADIVKNEITAHAIAASRLVPGVQTILEIGGQDSKIILLRGGIVTDFAMNTVCAAGTGSFLDHQSARLRIPIQEFGQLALKSSNPVRIAGRCSVFAESDMIHKQQLGYALTDIIAGLSEALVRNYLNNVGKGKEILAPVVFQGGVAANAGIKAAFEKALRTEIIVPPYFEVMGAVGAAMIAKKQVAKAGKTDFKGFMIIDADYRAKSFECEGCSNMCEIVQIFQDNAIIARWGGRCGRWENMTV